MFLASFEKFTLVDYPGKIATTVFTQGCNFRCPFCHNPELVFKYKSSLNSKNNVIEKKFFQFLEARKGKIEAVCITGGEPSLQPDLLKFMSKVKNKGYLVKLDTNGTKPSIIQEAIEKQIVDYIAMDIKHTLNKYEQAVGIKTKLDNIIKSVKLIQNSKIDYEFRTTVVPGIHREEDFKEIADWLKGSKKYYLQEYREEKILDPNLSQKTFQKKIDLEKIRKILIQKIERVEIRNYTD